MLDESAKEPAEQWQEPEPTEPEKTPAKAANPVQSEFPTEVKPSKLALGVEQKAIEAGLTKGFEGLPEYTTMNVAEQAQMVADLLKNDPEYAIQIAMGEENPPRGLRAMSVFFGVEDWAQQNQDVDLMQRLATMMQEVVTAREKASVKRNGPTAKAKVKITKDIKESIKTQNKQKEPWIRFLEKIKC